MSTKVSRRIAPLVLVAAVWAATQSVAPHAQSSTTATLSRRLSRSEHLRDWLAAVERHEPGRADESLNVFDSWRADDFQYLAIDVNTLLSVMADPRLRTFFYRVDGRSTPRQVVYSGSDMRLILDLARAANERGNPSLDPAVRLARNKYHVIERAAIFHTDAAIDALLGNRKGRRAPFGLQRFTASSCAAGTRRRSFTS
jgi:hypothetical protein